MTRDLVTRANLLVLGVLVAILALVGAVTWERLNASRDAREWSQHSYRVLGTTKDLAIALRDAERGQRGYLLMGRDEYLGPYNEAEPPRVFRRLQLLRDWSHDEAYPTLLPRGSRACGPAGAGARERARLAMVCDPVDCRQDRLLG